MTAAISKLPLTCLLLPFLWIGVAETQQANGQKVDSQQAERRTVAISVKDRQYKGHPLAWDGEEIMLLRRDGKMSLLPAESQEAISAVSDTFTPLSHQELRRKLQIEFRNKYQVSITQNFVVVHPPGDYATWAKPFQDLYSRFHAYFESRGMRLKDSEFPLVAVVLNSRGEFDRMLSTYHGGSDSKVLGYYNPMSNRIICYNQSSSRSGSKWLQNADTIIHEATHQTAFNTGLHSRYAPVPRWISEGLAMLFEAKGVNNSVHYSRVEDRINAGRLRTLKRYYKEGKLDGKLGSMVVKDDLFRHDPDMAYALAWGTTFYLSEKMPNKYHAFLRKDSRRTDFETYSSKQRWKDFTDFFGKDFRGMEANMKRFFAKF